MDPFFHAQNQEYRSPLGAVAAGTPVYFRMDLPKDGSYRQPRLIVCLADHWDSPQVLDMRMICAMAQENRFEAVFTPKEPALLFYS